MGEKEEQCETPAGLFPHLRASCGFVVSVFFKMHEKIRRYKVSSHKAIYDNDITGMIERGCRVTSLQTSFASSVNIILLPSSQ